MKHEFKYKPIYKDTDAEGVVYYANYLGFFEQGRTELLEKLGVDLKKIKEEQDIVFAINRVECDYKAPALLYDELTITTEIGSTTAARIIFKQQVKRGDQLLVSAKITACGISLKDFKPVRLPKDLQLASE